MGNGTTLNIDNILRQPEFPRHGAIPVVVLKVAQALSRRVGQLFF